MEKEASNKGYPLIDIAKFVFACSIPFFHITFEYTLPLHIVSQYFARLGVPFFFAASGFFLAKRLEDGEEKRVLSKYCRRNGFLLLFWWIVYSPLILRQYIILYGLSGYMLIKLLQNIICLAPAYLWYLVATLIGAIPFCLTYKRHFRSFAIGSILLYAVGVYGDTYINITNKGELFNVYLRWFITTRNGVFFTPLFFAIGAILHRHEVCIKNFYQKNRMSGILFLIIGYAVFAVEITSCYAQDVLGSMYYSLPLVIAALMALLISYSSDKRYVRLRHMSTIIYCAQYGIITIATMALSMLGFPVNIRGILIWFTVVAGGIFLTIILEKMPGSFLKKLL